MRGILTLSILLFMKNIVYEIHDQNEFFFQVKFERTIAVIYENLVLFSFDFKITLPDI